MFKDKPGTYYRFGRYDVGFDDDLQPIKTSIQSIKFSLFLRFGLQISALLLLVQIKSSEQFQNVLYTTFNWLKDPNTTFDMFVNEIAFINILLFFIAIVATVSFIAYSKHMDKKVRHDYFETIQRMYGFIALISLFLMGSTVYSILAGFYICTNAVMRLLQDNLYFTAIGSGQFVPPEVIFNEPSYVIGKVENNEKERSRKD